MKNYSTETRVQTLRERLQGHHLEAMITLAIATGMRRDELRHLTWSEIDLDKGEIHAWNEKTKNRSRLIHVPEESAQVLRQHRVRQIEQHSEADTTRPHLDLVFPDHAGGLLSIQNFLEQWYAFLKQEGFPCLRFHDLRALVWRRLLEQGRVARDGTQADLNKSAPGEDPSNG